MIATVFVNRAASQQLDPYNYVRDFVELPMQIS
jgi:hypothetical protein